MPPTISGPFVVCLCGRRISRETVFRNIDQRGPDECWPWKKGRDKNGYGRQCHRLATRLVWEFAHGPTTLFVLHRCDNPPCCNERHFFPGTQSDNSHDMWAKGRGNANHGLHGAQLHNAKLTDEKVRFIRRMAARESPESPGRIAFLLDVHRTAVQKVLSGESWRHVE